MTITISLEPEKEARLRERAMRAGRPAEQIVYDFVLKGLDEPEPDAEARAAVSVESAPTLAELFAGRTGKINSGGRFNYSRDTGKAFTESLLKQRAQRERPTEG
jgi:hypothetical protein